MGAGFSERFKALREARGLSQNQLSFALYDADREKRGYDTSFINRVEKGAKRPPLRFLLLVGEVLKPSLEELPEYHLAVARRQLDEREVGLEQAIANLRALEDLAAHGEGLPGPPAGELVQQLTAASPSQPDRQQSRSRGRGASDGRKKAA